MLQKKKTITPKDFYLNRMGPWPQPSPIHPWGEAPAVLKLPFRESLDWWLHIGSRYVATLALTPYYFLKGLLVPGLKPVGDERFEWFFNETILAKFICAELDEKDRAIFGKILEQDRPWYIVDLEAVKVVRSRDGVYCTGSKTLLYKDGDRFKVECIYIDESGETFYPFDGDAWELAKYFVLQGGALCSTLVSHPNQHFPVDSINAITKTSLPKEHVIHKLLFPHLRFTLALENAVLNYKSSLLKDRWWMVYAPYPGCPEGIRDLLVEGYKGIKGNASYPPFSFPMKEPNLETNYGIYLRTYYGVISKFVAAIAKDIPKGEIWTVRWADYVNKYVPGFPDGSKIFEEDSLHKALTSYLFTITVGHSVDHYNYGSLDKREIPLRIRQRPPKKGDAMRSRSQLCSPVDLMKYYLADRLFFKDSTVTPLIKTKYTFRESSQLKAVEEFKKGLVQAEKELLAKGIKYMPLKKIAASIQF